MLETILIATIPTLVISGVTGIVVSIYQRKKFLAETVLVEQQAVQKKLEIYEKFLQDTDKRIDKMMQEHRVREEEYLVRERGYISEIRELSTKVTKLEQDLNKFKYRACYNEHCVKRIISKDE